MLVINNLIKKYKKQSPRYAYSINYDSNILARMQHVDSNTPQGHKDYFEYVDCPN